jgi:hypothetical protein
VSARGREVPLWSRESPNRETLAPIPPHHRGLRSRLNVPFLARGTGPTSGKERLCHRKYRLRSKIYCLMTSSFKDRSLSGGAGLAESV